jgi:hypothetical protein
MAAAPPPLVAGGGGRILLAAFLAASLLASAANAAVSYDHRALVINGRRRILISGSIHYPRSTPEVPARAHGRLALPVSRFSRTNAACSGGALLRFTNQKL